MPRRNEIESNDQRAIEKRLADEQPVLSLKQLVAAGRLQYEFVPGAQDLDLRDNCRPHHFVVQGSKPCNDSRVTAMQIGERVAVEKMH